MPASGAVGSLCTAISYDPDSVLVSFDGGIKSCTSTSVKIHCHNDKGP